MNSIYLFNKWSYLDLTIEDISIAPYISIKGKFSVFVPHTSGKYNSKRFRKSNCPIVERLVCALMMHGRNSGKKLKAIRIVKDSFDIINLITNENPIQILINAIINSGPREDSTRIGYTGTARRQAVDVSPLRRINIALQLLTAGARESSFKNLKTISECLSDELINAARGSSNSFAIKKKDEIERVAKANR
jgi:small subunit ribosomal protein S5e